MVVESRIGGAIQELKFPRRVEFGAEHGQGLLARSPAERLVGYFLDVPHSVGILAGPTEGDWLRSAR